MPVYVWYVIVKRVWCNCFIRHDPWIVWGKPAICELFVSQVTGLMVGWSLEKSVGGPGYVYYRWKDLGPNPPADIFFMPPDLVCNVLNITF
jgi:hypothetical protein